MPISPTYPGVYIEEIPSGVHTIVGVATSIAAFLGRTAKGPLNKAVRCFNYSDFTRSFGGAHAYSDLAQSLRQFFNNGGTECYVIRLAHGAVSSGVTLQSLAQEDVLKATAKAEGKWGNTVRLEVDYDTPTPDESFNLEVIHEDQGKVASRETFKNLSMDPNSSRFAPTFVTDSSELIKLELASGLGDAKSSSSAYNTLLNSFVGFSISARPLGAAADAKTTLNGLINASTPKSKFQVSINDSPFVTVSLNPWTFSKTIPNSTLSEIAGHIQDVAKNALGTVTTDNDLICRFSSHTGTGMDVKNLLTFIANAGSKASIRIRRASANDLAGPLMLGVDQGGIEVVRWSNFRPAPTATFLKLGTIPSTTSTITDPVTDTSYPDDILSNWYNIADLIQGGTGAMTKLTIDGDDVALNTSSYNLVTSAAADKWFKSKPDATSEHGDNDGVREKMGIIKQAINNETDLLYRAEVWGHHLAIIASSGTLNKIPASVESDLSSPDSFGDSLVKNVRQYSLGTASDAGSDYFVSNKLDGIDGTAPLKSDYVGKESDQTGFHALDKVDIFNLMVLPADSEMDLTDIWGPASIYCEKKRAFLIIDAAPNWTNPNTGLAQVVQDTSKVDNLRNKVVNKSSAVFYPRLKYKSNGVSKLIGPSGAIAGLMARTDAGRGVWKAPAGTEADLRGILGLEVKLTDMENGVLNKLAVNCLREFPGSYVCWGSRTMDGYDNNTNADWKYIPVRRLALYIEESLFRGTKWVVFEPNDEPLWAKIRLNVGTFMMRLFKQGAFQGSTPDKAFYVKCDSETTPQADINLGIVNIEVGFAPLKPAEFVIIKIQQMAGEL
jgi:phage tail sheath protein FI